MKTLSKLFALGLLCSSTLVMGVQAAEIDAQEYVVSALADGKSADAILSELAASNPSAFADATGELLTLLPAQADDIIQSALIAADDADISAADVAAAAEAAGMAPEDITLAALTAGVDPTSVAPATAAGGTPPAQPVSTLVSPAPAVFSLPFPPSAPGAGGGGSGSGGGGFASAS